MIDTQKTSVLAAISSAEQHATDPVPIELACQLLGIDESRVSIREDHGMSVSRNHVEVSRTALPMTTLHALAHLATSDVFPPHGSEFCANLLHVTRELYPDAADAMQAVLDDTGAHYSDEHRKRAVIKAVVQRAVDGTSRVEAIFSSPPQRVEGSFRYDRRAGTITVDDELYELDRLRYLSRVS